MITRISGTLISKDSTSVEININQLTFSCLIPSTSNLVIGSVATFYTHLAWNSDTGPSLYAFNTNEEKQLFLLLISCSGIGPKAALSILSYINYTHIIDAIISQKTDLLIQIPGIGKKKAELILLELKNKINKIIPSIEYQSNALSESIDALKSLGYEEKNIFKALQELEKNTSSIYTTEEYITFALERIK